MATLTINGRDVQVDDSFLKLSPADQEKTVNEITGQMGAAQPTGPSGADILRSLPWQTQAGMLAQDFGANVVNGLPILGGLGDQLLNRFAPDYVKSRDVLDQAYPVAKVAGQAAGSIAPFAIGGEIPAAAKVLGMDSTMPLLGRAALSGASSAGIAGADTLSRGGSTQQAGQSAMMGGAIGAAAPFVGEAVQKVFQAPSDAMTGAMQRRATAEAVAGSPAAVDLKQAASDLFNKVDDSGVTVRTPAFSKFVMNTVQTAKKMGIDPTLDPKATAAYQRLIGALQDVQTNGGELTLSNLHTLRQIAQTAAMSTEGRDSMFANRIVSGLDDFIRQGGALSAPGGGNDLLNAISTWGRGSRVARVEAAIQAGQLAASGPENGIRLQFLKLMKDQRFMSQLSDVEKQAIKDVAQGTPGMNIARILGTFGVSTTSRLGATIGAGIGAAAGAPAGPIGSAIGAGAAMGAGTIARNVAENMRMRAAQTAAQALATPNLPVVPRVQIPAGPAVEMLMRAAAARQ